MKHKLSFIILFCILTIGSVWFVHNSSAFIGPTCPAGSDCAPFITNGRNLKIGGSTGAPYTLLDSTKLSIIASSSLTSQYLLKLVDQGETGGDSVLLSVNNSGGISIGTSTNSFGTTPNASGDGLRRLYVRGTLVADAINIASCTGAGCGGGNVSQLSSGVFGSSLSGSSTMLYAFPSSIGVGTSTQVSLPQTLSVYGGGYFSGNLGIGTSSSDFPLTIKAKDDVGLGSGIGIKIISSDDNSKSLTIRTTSGGSFLYHNGGTRGIGIDNNGNIDVFGIMPSGILPYSLNVNGTSKFYNDVYIASNLSLTNSTSTFSVLATSTMATSGGNVGIGTASPTQKLHVVGKGIVSDQLLVSTTTVPSSGYKLAVGGSVLLGGTPGGDGIRFADGTTQFTAYTPSGSPVTGSGTAGRVPLWSSSNALTNSEIYSTSSNIGIGAYPNASYKLDVTGGLRVTNNAIFGGSVGIGTASPGVILDVAPTDGFEAIKIRKSSAASAGMTLIVVQANSVSGASACGASRACIANIQTNGTPVVGGCTGSAATSFALCVDYSP